VGNETPPYPTSVVGRVDVEGAEIAREARRDLVGRDEGCIASSHRTADHDAVDLCDDEVLIHAERGLVDEVPPPVVFALLDSEREAAVGNAPTQ
jgi:hypothetical protein